MNVSAINCSPIKPQVSFGAPEGVDEANKVLTLSKELSDTFKKEDSEGNQIKNPLHTAVSVLTAGMAMFALGKGIGKLGWKGLDRQMCQRTQSSPLLCRDRRLPQQRQIQGQEIQRHQNRSRFNLSDKRGSRQDYGSRPIKIRQRS